MLRQIPEEALLKVGKVDPQEFVSDLAEKTAQHRGAGQFMDYLGKANPEQLVAMLTPFQADTEYGELTQRICSGEGMAWMAEVITIIKGG